VFCSAVASVGLGEPTSIAAADLRLRSHGRRDRQEDPLRPPLNSAVLTAYIPVVAVSTICYNI